MGKSNDKKKKSTDNVKKIKNKTTALVLAIVLFLCATVAFLVPMVIIPSVKYNEAVELLGQEKYDKASEIFAELGDFSDSREKLDEISVEKYKYALRLLESGENGVAVLALKDASQTVIKTDEVNEIKYQFAIRLTELGEYMMAARLFDTIENYKDSDKQLQLAFENQIKANTTSSGIRIGTEVALGTYEQDGNTENGGEVVEWLVVEQNDDSILLISKFALEKMPFADSLENFRWDKSLVRNWLNQEFYNSAFNEREKSMIMTSEVTGEVSEWYGTSLDFVVKDKIYLLNFLEVEEHFVGDPAKIAYATSYATGEDCDICEWWLRDHYGVCVAMDGSTKHANDNDLLNDTYYVRPVMRISYN